MGKESPGSVSGMKAEVKAMVKDTIQTVKEAEKKAAKLAKETVGKQEALLEEARQTIVSQKKDMETKLLEERNIALKKANRQNEEVMVNTMKQTEEEVTILQNKAKQKQKEVFRMILQELVS